MMMKNKRVIAVGSMLMGLVVLCAPALYAADVIVMRTDLLEGDYTGVIREGEGILSQSRRPSQLDEVYYLLGTGYLKTGNYQKAADSFQAVVTGYKRGAFAERSFLGLVDAYFLQNNYESAEKYCNEFLKQYSRSKFIPAAQYRLSRIKFRRGNSRESADILTQVRREHPLTVELKSQTEECLLADAPKPGVGTQYSVQVGAFSERDRAANLVKELKAKGYPAYSEAAVIRGSTSYRVRVGKSASSAEIIALERKLSAAGYPTKVCP